MTTFGMDNPTSYFSAPAPELDPTLFQGRTLRDWVRTGIVHLLQDHLNHKYRHPELWSHAWLAGSGVSYQWSADRHPGDLDCLVGVDFPQFRKANPEFRGLLDKEIADEINDGFHNELQTKTEDWNGYELTFYVNPTATDIRAIKPYAAYDLKYNEWTVAPNPAQEAPNNSAWDAVVDSDYQTAHQAHERFNYALNELKMAHPGPAQRNAQTRLLAAGAQASALYHEIHENRSAAFTPAGEGYGDFHNYRWQAGKRTGTIDMLREVKHYVDSMRSTHELATYGVELPDADTLVRRAALYGRN